MPDYYLPLEIQIRTVFEDAWGEIDHRFGYPIRTGKESKEVVNNPGGVLEHLKILKNFTDSCANYSEVICQEARGELDISNTKNSFIEVEPTDALIDRFRALGVANLSIQQYVDARILKLASLAGGKNIRKLYEAAEAFRLLTLTEPFESNFYLYSKLNQAFCLLSTGVSAEIHVAKDMYVALQGLYPKHPLISYRLGQVYNKLGKIDDAISVFKRAWLQVIDYEKTGEVGGDLLPDADYKHVRRYLPKLVGYNLWLQSEVKVGEEKRDLLMEAYNTTLNCVGSEHEWPELSAHNNLLYYQVALTLFCDEIIDKKKNHELGLKHLKAIDDCQNVDDITDLFYMDTLSKAFYLYSNKAEGVSMAKRIIDQVLSGEFEQTSDKNALEIAQEAKQLIEGGLTGAA
jgi:tetratricopeptide (TPR) repeat protein